MNNYEKYFGDIGKATETIVCLSSDNTCGFCAGGDNCDGECNKHIREFLEKPVETKEVRNCDLYKTPDEIRIAYMKYCKGKNCDECKYGRYSSLRCAFEFAYDYTEVEEDKKELHDALKEATQYFSEHTGKEFV